MGILRDRSGQALIQIIVIAGVLLAVMGGVLTIGNVQQGAIAVRRQHQDFYQILSAVGLLLESPTICGQTLSSAKLSGGSVGASASISASQFPSLPSNLSLSPGNVVAGQKIQSVSLTLQEDVGPFVIPQGGTSVTSEAFVAYISVLASNSQGVGAKSALFQLPLMVFVKKGSTQIVGCNASQGLLEYNQYANLSGSASSPLPYTISLTDTTKTTTGIVQVGSTGSPTTCPSGTYLIGASARFYVNNPNPSSNYNPDWQTIPPPLTDTTIANPLGGSATVTLAVENGGSCVASPGTTGYGTECQLYCISLLAASH